MMNRRGILQVLGLTGLGISTDAMGVSPDGTAPFLDHGSQKRQENIASSLEKLADEIRRGSVDAGDLVVNSELKLDEYIEHTITLKVMLMGKGEST